MKRKYIIILMQFLTSICIISVGFSSWIIVTPPISAEGQIVSSKIISTDDYLTITYDDLKYCKNGYVNDAILSYTGYITLNCSLDTEKFIYDHQHSYNSIRIEFVLSYDDYNLFETSAYQSFSHTIENNGLNITEKYPEGKKHKTYILDIVLNDVLGVDENNQCIYPSYEFSIIYQFNSSEEIFNDIYSSLSKTDSAFVIEVKMEGYNHA